MTTPQLVASRRGDWTSGFRSRIVLRRIYRGAKGPRITKDQGPKKMAISGLLERFKKGLARTAQLFNFRSWFGRKVDQSFLDELESQLIQADVGVSATTRLIDRIRESYADKTADEDLLEF